MSNRLRGLNKANREWAKKTASEDEPKIKMVKVRRPELGGYQWCASHLKGFDLSAEFEDDEIGARIEIELCEMTQTEIDAMPEFEGW